MNFKIITFVCALAICMPSVAQKRGKAKVKKKATPVVVENPGLILYKSMIPSTAKILFIDSVVVDKKNFLSQIPLNPESGRIGMRDIEYSQYENEFGDRAFFAAGDSTKSDLYAVDKVDGKWSAPTRLFDAIEGVDKVNYPFLMADGVTMYFGAKGSGTMGGYDIYMTTFDYDSGKFYTPENMGLPYNSTANDYLLVIDDVDKLGWLVTDRRQPEGKVCIYTFVPSESRQGFDDTDFDDSEIERFSRILSISDTWKFGNRKSGLARLNDLKSRLKTNAVKAAETESFAINDNIVYHSANNFKSEQARELYNGLKTKKKEFEDMQSRLSTMRRLYHDSNDSMRKGLETELLTLEKQVEDMNADMRATEKTIRNLENKHLNNL